MDKPVVDHRIYTIRPRGMAAFLEAFDQLAMPILLRHLGAPLAFYTSSIGPLNQVVHLWAMTASMTSRSAAQRGMPTRTLPRTCMPPATWWWLRKHAS